MELQPINPAPPPAVESQQAPPPQHDGSVPVQYAAAPGAVPVQYATAPGAVPVQYAAAPAQVISIPQWRLQMAPLPEVVVKQQIRAAEVLTDYDANNRYDICDISGRKVMFAGEDTDLLQRMCCSPTCRHWEVNVSQEVEGVRGSAYMHLQKDFSCTCLCLNRPEVRVDDVQGQNVTLGDLKFPFNCCDCPVIIQTPDQREMFTTSLDGNCCTQPGICCPCPCGPCETVAFKAVDPAGNEVAKMEKKVPGVLACLVSPETENYHVKFLGERTPEEKALLLSTALSIDLVYFSKKNNN